MTKSTRDSFYNCKAFLDQFIFISDPVPILAKELKETNVSDCKTYLNY